jgi:polysaccharide pyruvyl transferase WcaK-like protein
MQGSDDVRMQWQTAGTTRERTGPAPAVRARTGGAGPAENSAPAGAAGAVLLVVCLYENNFGDLLIYRTVEQRLRHSGWRTAMVEISQPVAESRLIDRANQADFLCFVGGGLIERSAPEIIRRFDVLHPHLEVPYGVVGLGAGAFDCSAFGKALKVLAEQAAFFHTRDEESLRVFRSAGATRLSPAGVDVVFANSTLRSLRGFGSDIRASFRNVPYVDVTGDLDWSAWGRALRASGVGSLVPDCHRAQEQLGIPVGDANILRQIAESRVIVAMRYHVVLVAALLGVPSIPVVYCPKVARLARQLGLEEYCLGLHDHHQLARTLQRLRADESGVRRRLDARVAALRAQADRLMTDSLAVIARQVRERKTSHRARV